MAPIHVSVPMNFGVENLAKTHHCNVQIDLNDGTTMGANSLILSYNSIVFEKLFEEENFTAMDDFESENARYFIQCLYSGNIKISNSSFRELSKLGAVFQVEWVRYECQNYFLIAVQSLKSSDEKQFRFIMEEATYARRVYKDSHLVDIVAKEMESVAPEIRNSNIICHLRLQLTNLSVEALDILLKMTIGDCLVLIKSILLFLDSDTGSYHVNMKYLLDRIDLEYCLEVDDALFYSLFEKLEALEDLSAADLREILHLSNVTTRHFINRTTHPSAPPDNSIQNLFSGPLSEIIGSAPDEEVFSILANSGKVKSLYMFFEGLSAYRGRIYPTVMEIDEAIKKRRWKPVIPVFFERMEYSSYYTDYRYNNLDHIKNNHIDNNDNFVMEMSQKIRWYEFFMNTREYVFVFSRFGLTRVPGCNKSNGKCGLCISVTSVSEENPDAFNIELVTDEAVYGSLPIHRHPEITPSRIHLALVSTRWSTFQNSFLRKPFLTADGVRYGENVYSARSTDEMRVIAYVRIK